MRKAVRNAFEIGKNYVTSITKKCNGIFIEIREILVSGIRGCE